MLAPVLIIVGIIILAATVKIMRPLPPHRNPKYFWNTTKYGGCWCHRDDYLKPGEKFVEEEEGFDGTCR